MMKHFVMIGSVSRSSVFLYQKMVSKIDFRHDLNIVEFGPWDGVFTDKIIAEMSPASRLTIYELDEDFGNMLQKKYVNDTRVKVYIENAAHARKHFESESLDCIISSLPLAFIPKSCVGDILDTSRHLLKPQWKFVQYQYFLQNKKQIHSYFPKTDYSFTLFNIPPAFVYICHK